MAKKQDEDIDYTKLPDDSIVRDDGTKRITGLSTEQRRIGAKEGWFPPPRKIGPRLNGWRLGTLLSWCRGEWEPDQSAA